ncbi:MAG TPA: hypothetical protein VF660_02120, partial [Actinomycetota bacterium]
PKLRTVVWDFAGDPLPPKLCEDLRRLAKVLNSGDLRRSLKELLSKDEIDATAKRADRLARVGRFPLPSSRRSYPWPPV